jgi:hypothetical protein
MRPVARRVAWSLCLALWTGCAGRQTPASEPEGTTLRYRAELAPDLGSMTVELCFRGAMFGGLIPGRPEAAARLTWLRWRSQPAGASAPVAGRIPIGPARREGCLSYGVELSEGGGLSAIVTRVDDQLVASPNAWLWRPALRPLKLSATLTLKLPAGIRASLPFRRASGGPPLPARTGTSIDEYELPDSVFAFDSHAAFGRFDEIEVEAAGVRAHAALLGPVRGLDRAAAERWLRDAVRIASGSDGRFPAGALHVLVIPGGSEPFGSVARGGGASVLLFVPTSFDRDKLARNWVLPHELSHLLLPFVKHEDAWLAEGLATYYQEVLRARAGVIGEDEALANIARALRSAQHEGTGRTLCDESRHMHQSHAYRAVYWGGAGALLLADLALRERSAGALSLDDLLKQIREEARMAPAYSARELLARMDELSHSALFRALGERCEASAFPDFEPGLRALGVDARGHVKEEAELAALRQQIFAQRK